MDVNKHKNSKFYLLRSINKQLTKTKIIKINNIKSCMKKLYLLIVIPVQLLFGQTNATDSLEQKLLASGVLSRHDLATKQPVSP